MYLENQFKTFNVWSEEDILHVFLTCPPKKYDQFSKTIKYVQKLLGVNFTMEYDKNQIYFQLNDFNAFL